MHRIHAAMFRVQFEAQRLLRDRRAQDMMEYALLVCLIALVIYSWFPQNYSMSYSRIWSRVSNVITRLTGV